MTKPDLNGVDFSSPRPFDGATIPGANPPAATRRISLAVRQVLRNWDRLNPGSAVVVACSGGADSLSLAATTLDLARRFDLPCAAVVIDHGIRQDSDLEAGRVADLLRFIGYAQVVVDRVSIGQLGGPEGAARNARYAALAGRALEISAGEAVLILLGHTLDDQAETVLLGLGRGSGARSLAGMPVSWTTEDGDADGVVTWSRPLLGLRRSDTEACCEELSLPFVRDPSNHPDGPWRSADGSALRRAAIRHRVLPALRESLGQDVAENLARSARLLRQDDEALQQWAEAVLERALVHSTECVATVVLDLAVLEGLAAAVGTRVLRMAALRAGAVRAELGETHTRNMWDLVVHWRGQKEVQLPGRVTLRRHRDSSTLVFSRS